jgi:predicted dehydrogenase
VDKTNFLWYNISIAKIKKFYGGISMIKIGLIGFVHDHSDPTLDCVRKYKDIFEVVGIADEDSENIKKYGGDEIYSGLQLMSADELLNYPGIEAVLVETEELKLVETAQRCIDKGLHVHVDKPAGTDIAAFGKLLRDAKAKSLTVQLGYMYRYNPAVQSCLESVKSGRLGEIYQVDAIMDSWYPPEKREWTNQFPGGNMFYLGCHMVDLVMLMQGVPEKIIPMNKSTGIDGVNALDHAFAVFEYKNGISTIRATLTECLGYNRRQLVVCGDRGVIEINPLELAANMPASSLLISREKKFTGAYTEQKLPEAAGRYDAMMLDFADVVSGKKANQFTYEYELLVQKAVLAACGMPVEVKYTTI